MMAVILKAKKRKANNANSEKDLKQSIYTAAEPGDIFFSRSRTFTSWLIRKITKCNFSHTFVKVNERTVLESDVGGVLIRPVSRYLDDDATSIELVKLPEHIDADIFIDALNQKVGSFYDYGILAGGILSKIFKISRWRENILNGVSRYTCSEFIAEGLKAAGAEFKINTSQITPKDLYYYLKNASKESQHAANRAQGH